MKVKEEKKGTERNLNESVEGESLLKAKVRKINAKFGSKEKWQ